MKTKLFFILAGIAVIKAANAQDLLVTNDSSRLQTVIVEIQPTTIKYSLVKNNGGPTYVISKSNVAYIIFNNGTSERYTKKPETEFNVYNLDGSTTGYHREYYRIPRHNKDLEHLYKRKNYLGFNHLALLNSNVSFTYMRDFVKERMILHVPISVGIGKPDITNSMYRGSFRNNNTVNIYNIMKYQAGLGLLFSPSFGQSVNFLIGPSFSFAQYDMSTKTRFGVVDTTQTYGIRHEDFKNDFTLFRLQCGGTLGFLFRISAKLNMSVTANLGFKKDSYSEKDPYGIEYINTKSKHELQEPTNVLPYANFAWSIGYRF